MILLLGTEVPASHRQQCFQVRVAVNKLFERSLKSIKPGTNSYKWPIILCVCKINMSVKFIKKGLTDAKGVPATFKSCIERET